MFKSRVLLFEADEKTKTYRTVVRFTLESVDTSKPPQLGLPRSIRCYLNEDSPALRNMHDWEARTDGSVDRETRLSVTEKILPVVSPCPRLSPSQLVCSSLHGPESLLHSQVLLCKVGGRIHLKRCYPSQHARLTAENESLCHVTQGSSRISKARLPGNPGSLPVC